MAGASSATAGAASAPGRAPSTTPQLLRRWQLALVAALVALAAVAWYSTDLRMTGMDAGPGTDPGALGFYVTTWVVMMAAMMFPSIAPMVLTYASLQRGRRAKGRAAPADATALFVAGYLLVWGLAGLIGYAVLKLGRAIDGDALAWDRAGRWVAFGVLIVAAAYELTPLKDVCLKRCRGPLGFLVGSWRDGRAGAVRMGFVHGAWCVGCCWALMAALFALGAMSLTWMVVIGALITVEKLVPWESVAKYGVAAALAGLAIGIAAAPGKVPALTVPTGQGMHMSGGGGMKGPAMEDSSGTKAPMKDSRPAPAMP